MKTAYLDCFSGISGDMFLGALLDAGLSLKLIGERLQTMPFKGYRIDTNLETRNGLSGTRFTVSLEEQQVSRNLKAISKIIEAGDLSRAVKEKSIEIFEDLAGVEGRIHNRAQEEVHFHEVGAVDSIIDIVGTVYGIECLGIKKLFCSPLPLGSGFVETAHGRIPVPAPATIALLKNIPVFDSGLQSEMVTPTGAALVKGLVASFGPMPPMVVKEVGYGAGARDLPDRPNLLRILIGDDQTEEDTDTVVVMETNLDDATPEWMGYLMERLMDAGALDVTFCPVQMKKNRPGVQVQVLGRPEHKEALMEVIFSESTTLGIRFRLTQRKILKRTMEEVDSPWGKIRVKKVVKSDGSSLFQPEYDACREIALQNDLPLREIFHWINGLNR